METNDLNNKADKLYRDLNKGLNDLSVYIDEAMNIALEAEKEAFANMTPKEISKRNAFIKKYQNLLKKGMPKEAQELKEKYTNE